MLILKDKVEHLMLFKAKYFKKFIINPHIQLRVVTIFLLLDSIIENKLAQKQLALTLSNCI